MKLILQIAFKGVEMEYELTFFEEDASFDWAGGTHHEMASNGFTVEVDDETEEIKLDTLNGYGAFIDVEDCQSLESLFDYIEKNKKYIAQNEENHMKYSFLADLLEFQTIILKNLIQKENSGIETDVTAVVIR